MENSSIGKKIKRLRGLRGLSQIDLQAATGINASWLSRIESGRAIPTEDEVGRIRVALGWTPEVDEHLDALAVQLPDAPQNAA